MSGALALSRVSRWPAWAVAALVALPLAALAVMALSGLQAGTWAGLVEGGLWTFAGTSMRLLVVVGFGVALVGGGTGWITARFDFPGSRVFGWLLVLPLAMPGYVVAYAYSDLLQFSGPVQTTLRESFGWRPREYWFPEIRSLGGAAFLFICVLFPYVYLPVRAAVQATPASLVEAGALTGRSPWAISTRIVLPLAWPALAGGVILCSMEVLADYGAVAHLAVDTFSVGIYKAWLGYGDRAAAVQLALILLAIVGALLWLEARVRGRRRFHGRSVPARPLAPVALRGGRAWACTMACAVPVMLGFFLPLGALVHVALRDAETHQWARYGKAAWATFSTAGMAAIVIVLVAWMLAYGARTVNTRTFRALVRVAALGYGVPGAVLAIAILIPLARFDNLLDAAVEAWFGVDLGLLLTGSVTALVYAYVVRFLAVGLSGTEAGFGRISVHVDEAARSLGASGLELARRVHLPLLWRTFLVAGLLVFVDALKELPATLALRPFDFETLATLAYQYAKDERLGEAAVPSLVVVAVAVVPTLLVTRVVARR